jgi:hypothetical protein
MIVFLCRGRWKKHIWYLLKTSITIGTVLGQGNLNRFECRFIMSREVKLALAKFAPIDWSFKLESVSIGWGSAATHLMSILPLGIIFEFIATKVPSEFSNREFASACTTRRTECCVLSYDLKSNVQQWYLIINYFETMSSIFLLECGKDGHACMLHHPILVNSF